MYVLILVGYVVLGGGQYAGSTTATQTILGRFDSAQDCLAALNSSDRARGFKEVNDNLREYRSGLLCAPGGSGEVK
jgi:hypothetical protein